MVKARETNTSRPGVVKSGDVRLAFWTAEKRNFFKIPCSEKYYFLSRMKNNSSKLVMCHKY